MPLVLNFFILISFLVSFLPTNIRCQCETNWFSENCSQIDICNYNNSRFCPNEFICKTIDDNQECLATGIVEGDKSQHSILNQYYPMNYHFGFVFIYNHQHIY